MFQQQPVEAAERCVLASAVGSGCWLVEAVSTSSASHCNGRLLLL